MRTGSLASADDWPAQRTLHMQTETDLVFATKRLCAPGHFDRSMGYLVSILL